MSTPQRLGKLFTPRAYTLQLDLDEAAMLFSGTVRLEGELLGKTFGLHARDLTITEASFNGTTITPDSENEHYEVMFTGKAIKPGKASIELTFNGKITEAMSGLYPSTFKHDGKVKQMFATQFEAPHAREVFPCIDEPAAKAVFELTLNTTEKHTVVSNTMPARESVSKGRKTTTFKPTPKMSPYLLAFATGELHSVEATTKNGTLVRSFATVAQPKSHLQYSVAEGVKILEFFEDYFQTAYPLEKCDHIALPDFDSGAMENWGMITYREIALLVNPDNRSVSSEQYVSMVIAHEVSHQWFGNLVTMSWWDDLWLNESFASLMEHIALDAIHPEWQQWETFAIQDIISTTSRDIYKDIQPVAVEVEDPELMSTLFDPGIVYAKGCRLLKMLREFIGEKAFRDGLQHYFSQHAYGNATRDDLWTCFAKSSDVDVKSLLDAWLLKPGMPALTITGNKTELTISQRRFMLDGNDDETVWPVPLLTPELDHDAILDKKTQSFATTKPYPMINRHASGHYFVHYTEPAHQKAIRTAMSQSNTPPEAKINVLNDMLLLSRGGLASMLDPLELILTMMDEPRYNVWAIMARVINAAGQLTEGNKETRRHLAALRVSLANQQHTELGWDDQPDDDTNTIQMRSMMASMMLAGEDEQALTYAKELVAASKSLDSLPAELRASLLAALVRQGDASLAQQLLQLYDESDPEMQLDIIVAVSATRNSEFAQTALSQAIGPKGFVRAQDMIRWIAYFMRNYHTRAVMWDLLRNDWDRFAQVFKNSKSYDFVPVYVAQTINTEPMAQEFMEFFTPLKSDPILKRNITIGMADIDARVAWRKREEAQIKQWVSAYISKAHH